MIFTVALPDALKSNLKKYLLFDHEPTPELFAILTVYFIQGVLGLAQLAVNFFLKDNLDLNPSQVAALMGIITLPWIMKPLFGFITDGVPIGGYRRRPYLILSGVLGTLAWISLAIFTHNIWTATLALILTSTSTMMSDVIIDAIVVERVRAESLIQSGSMQSLMWTTAAVGGLFAAYGSGWLLEHFSSQTVFGIAAIFPLFIIAISGLIAEEPMPVGEDHGSNIRQTIDLLWGTVRQKYILLPTLFICLWQVTPNADAAFFFFKTNELDFDPEFLGLVQFVSNLAILVGTAIYQRYLKAVSFRTILGWGIVLSAVVGMTSLLLVTHANREIGITDRWFCLGDSFLLMLASHISFLPVFILSARLCPPGIEATIFAFLVSVFGLSAMIANELGAMLTHWLGISDLNFDNLWILVVIANLSTLLPLPLLGWVPNEDPQIRSLPSILSSLPPVELSEHHIPGCLNTPVLMPELMPTFLMSPDPRELD